MSSSTSHGCRRAGAVLAAALALAVWLTAAMDAAPVRAQPESTEGSDAGSRSPPREPPRPAAPDETAAEDAPDIFVPSEEISGDTVVSFPVDI